MPNVPPARPTLKAARPAPNVAPNAAEAERTETRPTLGAQQSNSHNLSNGFKSALLKTRNRILVAVAAVGLISAVAVGTTVLRGQAASPGFEFKVISDPAEVISYIRNSHLSPEAEKKLEQRAQRQELVVWNVSQMPGWNGQQGEVFTIDNRIDSYQMVIRNEGQHFEVVAEKTTPSFSFSADARASTESMKGTWFTPAGRFPFNMQQGQVIEVPVR